MRGTRSGFSHTSLWLSSLYGCWVSKIFIALSAERHRSMGIVAWAAKENGSGSSVVSKEKESSVVRRVSGCSLSLLISKKQTLRKAATGCGVSWA